MTPRRQGLPLQSWLYAGGLFFLIILLGFLSEGYGEFSHHTDLTTFNVYGHRIMSRDRLDDMLLPYFGPSLNDVDIRAIRKDFEANLLVHSVKITREYPNTVNIYLRELVPVAYISLPKVYTVDVMGTLLPLPDKGMLYNLPIISDVPRGLDTTALGDRIADETVLAQIEFISMVRERYPGIYRDISELSYTTEQGIKLISARHSTPVFLGDWEQAADAMAVLAAFLEGDPAEQIIDPFQYIDLRFKQQVVVKERKS